MGGAIINIDSAKHRGELSFLYVKVGVQGKGIGQAIWRALEAMHPEVEVWETCTPKTDLALGDQYVVELFSFPSPPARPTNPEAAGLRHLAFEVDDILAEVEELERMGVEHEAIRIDPSTNRRFMFFHDPDGLPLELYEK